MGNRPTLISAAALGTSIVGIAHTTQKNNAIEKRVTTNETRLRQNVEELGDLSDKVEELQSTIYRLRERTKEQEEEIDGLKAQYEELRSIIDAMTGVSSSTRKSLAQSTFSPYAPNKHVGGSRQLELVESIKGGESLRPVKRAYIPPRIGERNRETSGDRDRERPRARSKSREKESRRSYSRSEDGEKEDQSYEEEKPVERPLPRRQEARPLEGRSQQPERGRPSTQPRRSVEETRRDASPDGSASEQEMDYEESFVLNRM